MVYDYFFQVSPQVKYLIWKKKISEYLKYLIHIQNILTSYYAFRFLSQRTSQAARSWDAFWVWTANTF